MDLAQCALFAGLVTAADAQVEMVDTGRVALGRRATHLHRKLPPVSGT